MKYAVLIVASLALGGCVTARNSATTKAAKCSGLEPTYYSSKKDSPETIKKARQDNAFGRRLGCW